MPRVTKKQVECAKDLDLLSYMKLYEPHNLVRKGNDYCTREHDSLVISDNNLWHWKSRDIGGRTALQYLIKVTDVHSAAKLQREIHISNRVKSDNEKIYYNIDKIHQAIGEKRKITFQYCSYSMSKRLVTQKGGKYYTHSPIALI